MLPRYAHPTNTWGNKQDDPISLAGRPQRCIGFFQTPTANTCDARRCLFTPLRVKLPRTKGGSDGLICKNAVFPRPFNTLQKKRCSAPRVHGEGVDGIHSALARNQTAGRGHFQRQSVRVIYVRRLTGYHFFLDVNEDAWVMILASAGQARLGPWVIRGKSGVRQGAVPSLETRASSAYGQRVQGRK